MRTFMKPQMSDPANEIPANPLFSTCAGEHAINCCKAPPTASHPRPRNLNIHLNLNQSALRGGALPGCSSACRPTCS